MINMFDIYKPIPINDFFSFLEFKDCHDILKIVTLEFASYFSSPLISKIEFIWKLQWISIIIKIVVNKIPVVPLLIFVSLSVVTFKLLVKKRTQDLNPQPWDKEATLLPLCHKYPFYQIYIHTLTIVPQYLFYPTYLQSLSHYWWKSSPNIFQTGLSCHW